MAKKLVFVLVLAAIVAGGLCAQEERKPNTIMFLGSMLSYERTLSPNWGVGAEFALDFFGFPSVYYKGEQDNLTWVAVWPLSVDAFARYYPWAHTFFTQLGLGIQMSTIGFIEENTTYLYDAFGFHAKAQVGWRLDIGKPNHWVFEAKLGPGISLGGVSDEDGESIDKASYFMFSFPIQLGFGLKF